MTDQTDREAVQYWYDAATERREERDRLRAVVARIRQMADYWEQQLPEVIRTPAVVSAIRTALEPAAVLPAPDNRAAVLLEAADIAEDVALRLRGEFLLDQVNGAYEVMSELRRRAREAQQDEAPCCSDPTCACDMVNAAGRCECAKWDDAPAREAQQDPTQDGEAATPDDQADLAAGLRAAADEIAGIDFHPNARARSLDIATGLARRLRRLADEVEQTPTQGGAAALCGAREPEPRTGTSPCVLPSGHGGVRHQDKWTNQWPITAVTRPGQPKTEA